MKQPNRECPRYEKCSVNNCPLHYSYPELCMDSEDREPRCTMEKNVRTRIGASYPKLKYAGLKQREYSAMLRESRMTPEEKAQREVRLKLNAFVCVPQVQHNEPIQLEVQQ